MHIQKFIYRFVIDTLVGQDAHCVLWAKYNGGQNATGRFDPYVLCYLFFIISYVYHFFLSKTKKTSALDSKSNFLRVGLSIHCLLDKGRFAPSKKASCLGYGTRRPLKWKKSSYFCRTLHHFVVLLSFY